MKTSMAGKKKVAQKKAAKTNNNATKKAVNPSRQINATKPATKKLDLEKECVDLRKVAIRKKGVFIETPLDPVGLSLSSKEIDREIHEEEERVELGGPLNPRKKFIKLEEFSIEHIHSASFDALFGNTDSANPLQRLIEEEERVAREMQEAEEEEGEEAVEPEYVEEEKEEAPLITGEMQAIYEAHLPEGPAPEDQLICTGCHQYSNNLNEKGCCPGCVEEEQKAVHITSDITYHHCVLAEAKKLGKDKKQTKNRVPKAERRLASKKKKMSKNVKKTKGDIKVNTAFRTALRGLNESERREFSTVMKDKKLNPQDIAHIARIITHHEENKLAKVRQFMELRFGKKPHCKPLRNANAKYRSIKRANVPADVPTDSIMEAEEIQYLMSKHGLDETEAAVAIGTI